ncbi:MAG: hypothetical protein ACLQDF_10135 [Desulfomonilia bacterium]
MKATTTQSDLLQAEKQVMAGVYGRLHNRYRRRFPQETVSALARAVTWALFHIEPEDQAALQFNSVYQDIIDAEIDNLKSDDEIRRVVTDTVVLKAVYLHRQRGCKDETYMAPIEHLKQFGIFLEGEKPPTPKGYIEMAKEFYASTPW